MFDNLKEIISVVQDGFSSSSTLRQAFSEVQRSKPRLSDNNYPPKVEFGAGAGILEHYQKSWAEIHEGSEECACAADQVDTLVREIHEKTKSRMIHTNDLFQSLSGLPRLSAAVDECVDQLSALERLLLTVETELTDLEDLVDRHESAARKLDHHYHLSLYKEKKLAALERQRAGLAEESAARHAERERTRLQALQARGQACAAAFSEDMRQYLTTGSPPPRLPPIADGLTLEQVQLDDTNEDELDEFLSS